MILIQIASQQGYSKVPKFESYDSFK